MKKFIILIIILLSLCSCTPYDNSKDGKDAPMTTEKLSGKLTIHFIDVGQGDSIFIELPNNKTMLIDGGESKYSSKIISYIDSLGYNRIDYLFGTHPHADHIGGLSAIIETFLIENIYMPKAVTNTKTYEHLLTTIMNKGLKIKTALANLEVLNEENLQATIVAPNSKKYSSLNNYSIVLKLVYGSTSYLFTGDAEELSENEIKGDIRADVLKVGHHGSKTSTSANFLSRVLPKYAIISVGENNSYNLPNKEIIKRLKDYKCEIYETRNNGTIIIKSDGKNYKVITEK